MLTPMLSTEQTNSPCLVQLNIEEVGTKKHIQCPGCHNVYVGKTDRNLITRLLWHGKKEDQPMFQHFCSCEVFNYKLNLYSSADIFSDTRMVDHMERVYDSVIDNCKILDSCNNWAILQYLETR